MVFSSLKFLYIFLPVFFICFYVVRRRYKNIVILAGSMIFYTLGAIDYPEHMVIFVLSIIADYLAGLIIVENEKYKKIVLVTVIIFYVVCLAVFKYLMFVTIELNNYITGYRFVAKVVQPLGISFFSFQGISYVVDVYRGVCLPQKSIIKFATYIAMFEQLIAGPIVTYDNVEEALEHKVISFNRVKNGIELFILGLGLKVLLANPLGNIWNGACGIGFESISTKLAWLSIVAYSLQIYLDFFGYSLMAIGLGKMMGFKIPKNFNQPYISVTMTEFWKRWHITLGSWYREYIYIPLGGNRNGTIITIRNLLIVWLLTGIWHGAGYNFMLWGLSLFLIITLEKYVIGDFLNRHRLIGHIYMLMRLMIFR